MQSASINETLTVDSDGGIDNASNGGYLVPSGNLVQADTPLPKAQLITVEYSLNSINETSVVTCIDTLVYSIGVPLDITTLYTAYDNTQDCAPIRTNVRDDVLRN